MLFNTEKEKVAIVFDKATLKKDKDGNKIAKMRFAIRLDADVAMHSPAEVRAAFEAVENRENKITDVSLSKELEGVNLAFYPLPDAKALTAAFNSVTLKDLTVERDEGSRAVPHVLFSVEVKVEDSNKLRHWIVDNVFDQMWAHFEMAQMTLVGPNAVESAAAIQ